MSKGSPSSGRGSQREPGKEKFWRHVLRDFAHSGQSIRAFCRQRQLSEPSFYAWRRTLAERDAVTPAGKAANMPAPTAPAFLPIRLADADTASVEIVLAGGHRIRLRPPVDRSALVEILTALRTPGLAEA